MPIQFLIKGILFYFISEKQSVGTRQDWIRSVADFDFIDNGILFFNKKVLDRHLSLHSGVVAMKRQMSQSQKYKIIIWLNSEAIEMSTKLYEDKFDNEMTSVADNCRYLPKLCAVMSSWPRKVSIRSRVALTVVDLPIYGCALIMKVFK